jgi:glycosyltransferase involved in cell wall biosynthesis
MDIKKDMDIKKEIEKGETLFAEGRLDEAEILFKSALEKEPLNYCALNDLGVIKHNKGDFKRAEEYFLQASSLKNDYLDPLLNLVDLYCSNKRWKDAAATLETCTEIDTENPDFYNQLGVVYLEIGSIEKARQSLLKSLEINPDQQIPKESLALLSKARQSEKTKPKIAFLCIPGFESFLKGIVHYFEKTYDVRTCFSARENEIASAIEWADIVWLEWANELTVEVTNRLNQLIEDKKVICRIHSYEVLGGYLGLIQWSAIDKAVFVAGHVLSIAQDLHPALAKQTDALVIHNGIDLEKFPFKKRSPGLNVAIVNLINHKKNPSMWIEIISRLVKINPNYTLKIAGKFQDIRYKIYLENIIAKLGLEENVRFFGHVDNIPAWFDREAINYLLTTSLFESFGYSIGEAMAMGCRPLIHAFPGAESIWPQECTFRCVDELIPMIQDKTNYNSDAYRDFVESRYPLDRQIAQIENLLSEMVPKDAEQIRPSEPRDPDKASAVSRSNIPAELGGYHSPEKCFIVTGIPRSGTSLFSKLLNDIDNAVCLNEIHYDVDSLPPAFAEIRRRLALGAPIPNRYDSSGNLTTDTQRSGVDVEERIVQSVDETAMIGSKVNIPYLNQIHKILDYGYKTIAIVRDPVYAIGSWNSDKAQIIPEAHVTEDDKHPRWQNFTFTTNDKIERQAQIWNFYADLIWRLRDSIKIYTYESLTSDPERIMREVCDFLNLELPEKIAEMKSQNIDSKYPRMEEIRKAVEKYCPVRKVFR